MPSGSSDDMSGRPGVSWSEASGTKVMPSCAGLVKVVGGAALVATLGTNAGASARRSEPILDCVECSLSACLRTLGTYHSRLPRTGDPLLAASFASCGAADTASSLLLFRSGEPMSKVSHHDNDCGHCDERMGEHRTKSIRLLATVDNGRVHENRISHVLSRSNSSIACCT
jgi:hypothetical protein